MRAPLSSFLEGVLYKYPNLINEGIIIYHFWNCCALLFFRGIALLHIYTDIHYSRPYIHVWHCMPKIAYGLCRSRQWRSWGAGGQAPPGAKVGGAKMSKTFNFFKLIF